ncbi:MAG: MATE family efflux transporter [Pseudomonadota bacterium]
MNALSAWRRLCSFVALSLKESDIDYPREPVPRALGLLAIPMMLEMSMEAVFAIVDIAFVSVLGTDAVAAVGITEALVTILYAVAIGLGMGVTAMVSRRIGEGDRDSAAAVTGQAIWIGAAMSVLIGYIGIRYGADLLRLMGASDSVVETGAGFTTVLLGGSFSILFLFLLNAAFRGAGDANIALRSLWLANGINIVLDPCLIFGLGPFPEMGVTGAAVATTIGRGVGVTYQLYHLFDGRGRLVCAWQHLQPVPPLLLRILKISVGGVGQFLIATSSWIVMMRIVAVHGSAAIAAYTIALRLVEFAFLPAWGLGNATATLVGQNLGAGQPEKAESSGWTAAKFNAVFMTGLGLSLLVFANTIAGWFSDDSAVIDIATACLRILGIGYPMYAVGMIMVQALNGAGDTVWPSILNLICFWLVQIPAAWYLAQTVGLGPYGVFTAIVVSECLLTLLSVLVFRRGRWKTVEA